jgi:hypothetical protein
MGDTDTKKQQQAALPSVDEAKPIEEGGPTARSGFTYQDEIAVAFLIEMLETPALLKVHCETHDDIVLVYAGEAGQRFAEFVQVKSNEPDQLWSVAGLCARKDGRTGTSIFETSLARDRCRETSRFRIVTLRPVTSDLKMLTYPKGAPGRDSDGEVFKALQRELHTRFPGAISVKGNDSSYWLENCCWDQTQTKEAVATSSLVRLIKLSVSEERTLLPERAEVLLEELRVMVRDAGDAKWDSDRDKKIIANSQLRTWWENRTTELQQTATTPSGGKLRDKMREAGLPDDLIDLAIDMRRRYAMSVRASRYMETTDWDLLQDRVKSEAASLRARLVAGQLDLDGVGFHSHCLDRMDALSSGMTADGMDRSAFLKGCMYDIADRCLLRFARRQ